jgi:hypothetical protein
LGNMPDNTTGIQPNTSLPPQEYGSDLPAKRRVGRLEPSTLGVPSLPDLKRYCEPHRGRLMRTLGVVSLALGGLATAFFPLAALAIPLSLLTWFLARMDLTRIRDGLMDPCGERPTYEALNDSVAGLLLSLSGLVIWGALFFCMILGR